MQNIKIVGINARFVHSCLALFYIRNELEKKCTKVQTSIHQFTINDNYYEMVLRLSEEDPDYIFFSTAIWNSTLVERLVHDLFSCIPNCRIVIGGPQSGVLAGRLGADYCTFVSGEFEAVGQQFYLDLENNTLAESYRCARVNNRTQVYNYPYRESDFHSHLENRHIYYESSRGCPFSCSYCLSAAEKGIYHKRLDEVEKELSDILRHRPKIVRFIDRTFNALPDRALAIWEFLAIHGGDTLFHFEIAPDRFTPQMFDFLEKLEPGRFQFELGIQTTHTRTLAAINRRIDSAAAYRIVTRLAGMQNIHLHVDIILGLPYETIESFAASFRDVFAMGAHYIQMGLLKILPDTQITQSVEEYGYTHCDQPPYSVLQTAWMDHTTLSELYWFSECVEKFLNNRYFISFWSYLRCKENEDIFFFFQALLKSCRQSGFFQLAATQELLCSKLFEIIGERDDKDLLVEILRFDWLRCGFRFLPKILQMADGAASPAEIRSTLYKSLPAECEGLYTKGTRNHFFRKSFFLNFSQSALRELGFVTSAKYSCLCFLPEKEQGLFSLNRAVVLQHIQKSDYE